MRTKFYQNKSMLAVVLAVVLFLGFPARVYATETAEAQTSLILSGQIPQAEGNADAQKVYQEFLDTVSFIATDDTWTSILKIKGVREPSYNYTVPDGEGKIPYEELSDFDKFIYHYTYCVFAASKKGSVEDWKSITTNREAIAICYQDYLNFKPTEGNNREIVNAAFEKLWDWQYEYIKEHDEPYNFIANCSYTDMGFGVTGSGVEQTSNNTELSKEEEKEIQQASQDMSPEERKELEEAIQEVEQEMKKDEKETKSSSLLPVGIAAAALVVVGAAFVVMRKKNADGANK